MTSQDFSFTTLDGLSLQGRFLPVEQPAGLVCLVHGLGEHQGRYDHVARVFAARGLAFASFDLRGHGRSEGKRGHTPSYRHLQDDIARFLARCRQQFAGLPLALYGHSLGGNLALNYLLEHPEKLVAALITSPWLRLTHPPKGLPLFLARFGARLLPALTQPNGLQVVDISSVPAEQQAYASDPLNHDRISARLFREVNRMGQQAVTRAGRLQIPVLLAHGSADNITSPAGSEQFAMQAPAGLVTLKIWEDLRHETHREHNKEEVLAFYSAWLAGQLHKNQQ